MIAVARSSFTNSSSTETSPSSKGRDDGVEFVRRVVPVTDSAHGNAPVFSFTVDSNDPSLTSTVTRSPSLTSVQRFHDDAVSVGHDGPALGEPSFRVIGAQECPVAREKLRASVEEMATVHQQCAASAREVALLGAERSRTAKIMVRRRSATYSVASSRTAVVASRTRCAGRRT